MQEQEHLKMKYSPYNLAAASTVVPLQLPSGAWYQANHDLLKHLTFHFQKTNEENKSNPQKGQGKLKRGSS